MYSTGEMYMQLPTINKSFVGWLTRPVWSTHVEQGQLVGAVLVGSWVHCIRVELLGHGHEGIQLGDVGEVGYTQGMEKQATHITSTQHIKIRALWRGSSLGKAYERH